MTAIYFHQLNYTMANEDTNLEYDMVKALGSASILTVGGSGSRSLPFLGLPISTLKIVDVSPLQVKFIQFKLKTIRQLSREDAIAFWIGEDHEKRKSIVAKMNLDADFQDFIQSQFELNGTEIAPLYWGKWEKTFAKFSKIASLLFSEKVRRELFDAKDSFQYYQKNIKGFKWTLLLRMVGNSAIFNSLLYKGDMIKKNSELSYFDYYQRSFERLFALDIRRSHFLQICFFGKVIHEEALPIEFRPDVFEAIKQSKIEPEYEVGSIFEEKNSKSYDFVSLSDVPSYLGGEIEKEFQQAIKKKLNPGGVIVNRYYLRRPENMNLAGLKDVSQEFKTLSSQELVQMYDVHILRNA